MQNPVQPPALYVPDTAELHHFPYLPAHFRLIAVDFAVLALRLGVKGAFLIPPQRIGEKLRALGAKFLPAAVVLTAENASETASYLFGLN